MACELRDRRAIIGVNSFLIAEKASILSSLRAKSAKLNQFKDILLG